MGIWGSNLLDNDAALGIKELWDKEIRRYLKRDPNKLSAERIIDFFLENHFNGKFEYGDFHNNLEILALAYLLTDNDFTLPTDFKDIVVNVIALELTDESLREWKNKEKRKKALLNLLERIGGKLKDIDEIKVDYLALEFNNKKELLEKIDTWLDNSDMLDREYPRFLKTLDKIITSRLGFEYDKLYLEGTQQRLMLLAFYLGWWLELPKNQVLELVNKAKDKTFL